MHHTSGSIPLHALLHMLSLQSAQCCLCAMQPMHKAVAWSAASGSDRSQLVIAASDLQGHSYVACSTGQTPTSGKAQSVMRWSHLPCTVTPAAPDKHYPHEHLSRASSWNGHLPRHCASVPHISARDQKRSPSSQPSCTLLSPGLTVSWSLGLTKAISSPTKQR